MKKIKVDKLVTYFTTSDLIDYLTNKPHNFNYIKNSWLEFNVLEIYNMKPDEKN